MCSKRNHQQREKDKVWNEKNTIFVNHIFDKILIFKIHNSHNSIAKKKKKLKMGKTLNRYFSKEDISTRPTNTWKGIQHH